MRRCSCSAVRVCCCSSHMGCLLALCSAGMHLLRAAMLRLQWPLLSGSSSCFGGMARERVCLLLFLVLRQQQVYMSTTPFRVRQLRSCGALLDAAGGPAAIMLQFWACFLQLQYIKLACQQQQNQCLSAGAAVRRISFPARSLDV